MGGLVGREGLTSVLHSLFLEVADDVPTLKLKGGYVGPHIVRKQALARQAGNVAGWEECSIETLQTLSVDRCAFLECFDASWSAAEVSLFIYGRSYWPHFASMFMCLWNEVAEKLPDAEALIDRARSSGQARRVLEEFRERHGFSPHPHTFVTRLRFDANSNT